MARHRDRRPAEPTCAFKTDTEAEGYAKHARLMTGIHAYPRCIHSFVPFGVLLDRYNTTYLVLFLVHCV